MKTINYKKLAEKRKKQFLAMLDRTILTLKKNKENLLKQNVSKKQNDAYAERAKKGIHDSLLEKLRMHEGWLLEYEQMVIAASKLNNKRSDSRQKLLSAHNEKYSNILNHLEAGFKEAQAIIDLADKITDKKIADKEMKRAATIFDRVLMTNYIKMGKLNGQLLSVMEKMGDNLQNY